jgi:hypothetical protein
MPESDLGMQDTHSGYYETLYDTFVRHDAQGRPLNLARFAPTDTHQRDRQKLRVIRNLVAIDGDDVLDEDGDEYVRRVRATRHEVAAHIMMDCALVKLKGQQGLINSLLPPTPTISTHEAKLVIAVLHHYYHDPLCLRYPLLDPATTFRPINAVAFKSAERTALVERFGVSQDSIATLGKYLTDKASNTKASVASKVY